MRTAFKIIGALVVLAIVAALWPAFQFYREIDKSRSEDPLVWEENIQVLEERTAGRYGPGEAVVFIGSSSIRFWGTLEEDMAPNAVLRHGFGGAKLNDVVYYAERLVNAYEPAAVVVFAGTNDISPEHSKEPEALLASYREFVDIVRADDPDLPIFYIGITPSPLRWPVWPVAQETNRLIADWIATDENHYYIDTSPELLGENGGPKRDHYVFDGLHLSDKGYAVWREIVRDALSRRLPNFQ